MNQFPCRRAVVVLPEAVSFQVIVEAAVSVVEFCAFTMNSGSVAEASGMSVGSRQGALGIYVTSWVEGLTLGYSPGGKEAVELSQVRLVGAGTAAPTNRLKMLVPPDVLLMRVAGTGGVVLASEMSLANLPGNLAASVTLMPRMIAVVRAASTMVKAAAPATTVNETMEDTKEEPTPASTADSK